MFALPILLGAAMLAIFLGDEFTAVATIDIDLQGANVKTLEPIQITTYADQYIGKLEDRVLASKNLVALANESNLFPPELADLSESERIGIVRNSVFVSVTTQPVMGGGGRTVDLISGFAVQVASADPQFAYRVANYVANKFLEADRNSRTERASSTSSFLREQMSNTELEIVKFEQQIADFKVVNACCLPELMSLNLLVIERTERDIDDLQPRIRTLDKDRTFKLSQIEEIRQQTASTNRLADLEEEYLGLVANYGPEHPDVIRVRREITAITGTSGSIDDEGNELVLLRVRLAEAEQRYSQEHPDVIRYKREIAAIEAKQRQTGDSTAAQAKLLSNSRYLQLRAELNNIETELAEQRRRVPVLRAKIADYESRITRTPQIESEYQALSRKEKVARENFENLQDRLVIASQTEALESTDIGARLIESRPAYLPSSPSGPPRIAIMVIATFFAVSVSVGAMILAELADPTIRSRKDIESIMDMVPLATIPVIDSTADQPAHQRQLYWISGLTLAVAAVVILLYRSGVL
jgi:uncharacterized protein involved in exopolysaccharide biosynthesis